MNENENLWVVNMLQKSKVPCMAETQRLRRLSVELMHDQTAYPNTHAESRQGHFLLNVRRALIGVELISNTQQYMGFWHCAVSSSTRFAPHTTSVMNL